jgi:TPR repeat protein
MTALRPMILLAALLIIASCARLFSPNDIQLAAEAYTAGDYATALRLWRPLAERETRTAQFGLGVLYEDGNGVPRDYAKAEHWYRKAADRGYAKAQYNEGRLYEHGLGVSVDTLQAAKWYILAARQGNPMAQYSLALLYVNDPSVTCAAVVPRDCEAMLGDQPDLKLGAIWYRLSAQQGMDFAQNSLGAMYGAGLGVPLDDVEAYAWFSISADQGNHAAEHNRDSTASRMSPESLGAGQKLARQYWELYALPFQK